MKSKGEPCLPFSPPSRASGVGHVAALGEDSHRFHLGDRVVCLDLIPPAASVLPAVQAMKICEPVSRTGRMPMGGYAECMLAPEIFAYPLPATLTDAQLPLAVCRPVGYRSLRSPA